MRRMPGSEDLGKPLKKKRASAGAVRGVTRRRPSPKEETAIGNECPYLVSARYNTLGVGSSL
jgi:hypothetical protein